MSIEPLSRLCGCSFDILVKRQRVTSSMPSTRKGLGGDSLFTRRRDFTWTPAMVVQLSSRLDGVLLTAVLWNDDHSTRHSNGPGQHHSKLMNISFNINWNLSTAQDKCHPTFHRQSLNGLCHSSVRQCLTTHRNIGEGLSDGRECRCTAVACCLCRSFTYRARMEWKTARFALLVKSVSYIDIFDWTLAQVWNGTKQAILTIGWILRRDGAELVSMQIVSMHWIEFINWLDHHVKLCID